MNPLAQFTLKVKRGEGPFYRRLRHAAKWILRANAPLPDVLKPVLRAFYELHFFIIIVFRWLRGFLYISPLFRSRCAEVGRNLQIYGPMPYVSGHLEIHIGDNVTVNSPVQFASGRFCDHPRLIIHDRALIGAQSIISVNREIVIEEGAWIGVNCRIADSDGHPKQADKRLAFADLDPSEIRPVRIGRYAWVGNGSHVMKGVTVGEGAIIGPNSVVITNIPPYCIAMGNPAEVFFRNVGKPSGSAASA